MITESMVYGKIIIIVCGCFALYKLTNLLFKLITNHLSAKHWVFNGLLCAVQKPLKFLFILLGLGIILQALVIHLNLPKVKLIFQIEILTLIFCIAWAAIRFVGEIKKHALAFNKSYEDKTLAIAFSQIVTVAIVLISLLICLHILNVNIAGILALGGIGGIALGFAAKDTLANFCGALMIYIDKPFQVGDWICSPEKQIEGIVESIGWRQVKIITFETRPIYVPNSIFSNIIIENPTRMTHRRIKEKFYLRYQDLHLVESILQEIGLMLNLHPKVDNNKDIIVNIVNFEESVNIVLICYVNEIQSVKFHLARQEVLLECAKIVEKHGGQISFPLIDHLKK